MLFYYVTINEIPRELSRENIISSTWKDHPFCCYIINCAICNRKKFSEWSGISLVFIWLFSCSKIFPSIGEKFRILAWPKNMLCLFSFSLEFPKITNLLMTIGMINRKCSLMVVPCFNLALLAFVFTVIFWRPSNKLPSLYLPGAGWSGQNVWYGIWTSGRSNLPLFSLYS